MSLYSEAATAYKIRDRLEHAHLLKPELALTLREVPRIGIMLHGPLIITMYDDDPDSIQAYNESYEALQTELNEALDEGRRSTAIFSYTTRPCRTYLFDLLAPEMRDREYWRLLSKLWVDQENPEDFLDEWHERFDSDRPHRCAMMTADDRRQFAEMPDELVVYRGAPDTEGFSWTTDINVAKFFSRRFRKPDKAHPVWQSTVQKENVLAFLAERGESEVLILNRVDAKRLM